VNVVDDAGVLIAAEHDERVARAASGALPGAAGASDIVDGRVVLLAGSSSAGVLTSDPEDLASLADPPSRTAGHRPRPVDASERQPSADGRYRRWSAAA
jgi:hypothetical protein